MGRVFQTGAMCVAAVLGLALAAAGRRQTALPAPSPLSTEATDQDVPLLAHFSPHLARTLSLGFWQGASAWLSFRMVDFLSFEGEDITGGQATRKRALQAIAAVRPATESIYLLACYQLALTDDDPAACARISEAGLAQFPGSFQIAMMQGYVSGMLLDSNAEAVRWFTIARDIPGSPALAGKMAELYKNAQPLDPTTFSESIAFFDDLPGGSGFKEMLQDEAQESSAEGSPGDEGDSTTSEGTPGEENPATETPAGADTPTEGNVDGAQ